MLQRWLVFTTVCLGCGAMPHAQLARIQLDEKSVAGAMAAALTRCLGFSGEQPRVERDGESYVAYAATLDKYSSVAFEDRDKRALCMLQVAMGSIHIALGSIGPVVWGEHPKPSACVAQLWPGTQEPTTNGLCIDFEHDYRPMWLALRWSNEIATRTETLVSSAAVLANLKRQNPTAIWSERSRLLLESSGPQYEFTSSDAESQERTRVNATNGKTIGRERRVFPKRLE
jgi:hypothetical protein